MRWESPGEPCFARAAISEVTSPSTSPFNDSSWPTRLLSSTASLLSSMIFPLLGSFRGLFLPSNYVVRGAILALSKLHSKLEVFLPFKLLWQTDHVGL